MNLAIILRRITPLPFLLLVVCTACYGRFRPMDHVIADVEGASTFEVADLNSDGHLDIVVTTGGGSILGWCRNDGFRTFDSLAIIGSGFQGTIKAICVADVDSDGDLDLLSSLVFDPGHGSPASSTILWHANEGTGQFREAQVVGAKHTGKILSLSAVDLDRDDNMDLVFASKVLDYFGNSVLHAKIGWLANDGLGQFTQQPNISSAETDQGSVCLVDLDGDENVDILASMDESNIVWFRNLGQGQVDSYQVISTLPSRINKLCTADLNGDGHPDILAASRGGEEHSSVVWFENDGLAGFSTSREIAAVRRPSPLIQIISLATTDVDQDGDLDVIAGSRDCAPVRCQGVVAWYANDGTGEFSFERPLTDVGSFGLIPADLDNDKDPDLVFSEDRYGKLLWLESGGAGYGPRVMIPTDLTSANSISAVDIDGDHDLDLLATGWEGGDEYLIVWQENKGLRQFGETKVIFKQSQTEVRGGFAIYPADLDGDSDTDVISVHQEQNGRVVTHWHRNAGMGVFTSHTIHSGPGYATARKVLAADIDNDDDLDLIEYGRNVGWYANDGSGRFGSMQLISSHASKHMSVVDMDGDDDLDIVATLRWYENDGFGEFGTEHVISDDTAGVNVVHPADVDGDGDPDIFVAAYKYSSSQAFVRYIAWYENDGLGQFGSKIVISSDVRLIEAMEATDLDEDGDLDLVVTVDYNYRGQLAWYENKGEGMFGESQFIHDRPQQISGVHIADIDSDGDVDILTASYGEEAIVLYDNERVDNNAIGITSWSSSTPLTRRD